MSENAIPKMHTLTAHLTCNEAVQAIDWYAKAFGAVEEFRLVGDDGRLMHARMRLGDTWFMLNDEFREHGGKSARTLGGSPVTLHIYADNADTVFNRAVDAGAQVVMPLADMFWGDRYGLLADPYGHQWAVAQHLQDLSGQQIKDNMAQQCG